MRETASERVSKRKGEGEKEEVMGRGRDQVTERGREERGSQAERE